MVGHSRVIWENFIQTHDGAQIAAQLRHDQELCKARRLPSLLALYMPTPDSVIAGKVSFELQPDNASLPRSIRNLQYCGIIDGIKAHLEQMNHRSTRVDPDLRSEPLDIEPHLSAEKLSTALAVVKHLLQDPALPHLHGEGSIKSLVDHLTDSLEFNPACVIQKRLSEDEFKGKKLQNCYICQMRLLQSHPEYSSLCNACGRFNLAESSLSLPQNLNLKGKTALVTGGRLNLGYHTALRLLRCGAKVIVSTRYPHDAESRYVAEMDSPEWRRRLSIVGADFRAAKDVFQLVSVVKEQLERWRAQESEQIEAKLDILINNAAQTLTDPIETEREAIALDKQLRLTAENITLVNNSHGYEPRVRGGTENVGLLSSPISSKTQAIISSMPENSTSNASSISHQDSSKHGALSGASSANQKVTTLARTAPKSSWMQSLHEIPYEDVVSAHSVNTLVPLILIREFLPLMGSTQKSTSSSSSESRRALAHIINVSSREGIFESSPSSSSKGGHHVHTNMSKAGLNMITETEAQRCWKERKVAMNSVDPGYMSAAPEIAAHWGKGPRAQCPIGWEDGAGRVLWPIAVSGRREEEVWGRFLKHFGTVEVTVGVGR